VRALTVAVAFDLSALFMVGATFNFPSATAVLSIVGTSIAVGVFGCGSKESGLLWGDGEGMPASEVLNSGGGLLTNVLPITANNESPPTRDSLIRKV